MEEVEETGQALGGLQLQEGPEVERITYSHPIVQYSDMPDDMQSDTVDLCTNACEKFANNNEKAGRHIKETMDKKYGVGWHSIVGANFGFAITHELKNLLYMFYGGTTAVCVWKCTGQND